MTATSTTTHSNMGHYYPHQPLVTRESAVFNYSQHIEEAFTFTDNYGEEYKVFHTESNGCLHVPRNACPVGVSDLRCLGAAVPFTSNFTPKSREQARVVLESCGLIDQGRSFIVEAPTGFGKTYVGAAIIGAYRRKAAIVVTKEDIKEQWRDALKAVLGLTDEQIGVLQADQVKVTGTHVDLHMVHSVGNLDKYKDVDFSQYGLVLIDEVHRMGAPVFCRAMWRYPGLIRVGMSATPKRSDGRENVFKMHIGETLVRSSQIPMIPKVVIKKTNYTVPPIPHEIGKIGHITKIIAKNGPRNALLADFIHKAYSVGRRIIVFSDLTAHLDLLRHMAINSGVVPEDTAFYVGGMSAAAREQAKKAKVIFATYKMASEATNIPELDCGVLATPKADVVQIAGRIMRELPGKKKPLLFDPLDSGSNVLAAYANKRYKWYQSIGAEILHK